LLDSLRSLLESSETLSAPFDIAAGVLCFPGSKELLAWLVPLRVAGLKLDYTAQTMRASDARVLDAITAFADAVRGAQ
jgi:hypothetical protein